MYVSNMTLLDEFSQINKSQIRSAGPRYTPGMDPDGPNIQIRSLVLALAALGFEDAFKQHLDDLGSALHEARLYPPQPVTGAFRGRKFTPEFIESTLHSLSLCTADNAKGLSKELQLSVHHVTCLLLRLQDRLFNRRRAGKSEKVRQAVDSNLASVRHLTATVSDIQDLCEAPTFSLLTTNTLFLDGDWGTGKTHFLCDFTNRRMGDGKPTLLYLAQHLARGKNPVQALCDQTGLAETPAELLDRLQGLGQASGGRALLIIDGINEGDRDEWRSALESIARLARKYSHVGIVLSCRRPFDQHILTEQATSKWVRVSHPGFADVEFDAQVEYFTYYDIPAPQMPLLTPEFSRPLFLKLFCLTIRELAKSGKRHYLREVASGQKGMTRVLEDFVRAIGSKIEDEFGLRRNRCWEILKGIKMAGGKRLVGIAPAMAEGARDHLSREECLAIIGQINRWSSGEQSEAFLQRLLADGLLMDGVHWQDAGVYEDVIHFPYQRFSDHLIARHLLDQHLDTSTELSIRKSFYGRRPLGRIFQLRPGGYSYNMPGLASAIMLEFQERVRRHLPQDERELVFYLPRDRRRVEPVRDVFLDGLYWRSANSFTERTDHVLSVLLEKSNESTRNEVLEILVGLATRPGHPYSAERLRTYLEQMQMPERDLFWSEYLRSADDTSVIFRLLEWVERAFSENISEQASNSTVSLLSMFLTTSRRLLPDRATRGLYLIGLRQPKILFEASIKTLSFNDPYVPERMLAACYGVAMSRWADPRGRVVRKALPELACMLAQEMFVPAAPHSTRHVLMQDYALGVIELAQKVAPRSIPKDHLPYVKRPLEHLSVPFPPGAAIDEEESEKVASALHMDFENYTLGRLVEGRRNYDSQHATYRTLRKQILWRIADLGYSEASFGAIDRMIDRFAWPLRGDNPGKTDRYGKKYSWISYFEMYGVRLDEKALPEWRIEDRIADADIDPSFPVEPLRWGSRLPNPFEGSPTSARPWLADGLDPDYRELLQREEIDDLPGPWLLLEGFVEQAAPQDSRRIFTFLRGLILEDARIKELLKAFDTEPYPGNMAIPTPGQDYYTYSGEIPWSYRFAPYLRTATGSVAADVREAYERIFRPGDSPGIPVEIPAYEFMWEGAHCALNEVSGALMPSPALCSAFELVNHEREWDLYESNGKRATIYRVHRDGGGTLKSHFLYMRLDLVKLYLQRKARSLAWLVWGERTLQHQEFMARQEEISGVLAAHDHIHKQAYVWSEANLKEALSDSP